MRTLDEVARSQHGLITREQLLESLTVHQIDRWVSAGRLHVVHRGVYRASGAPETWEQRLNAATLAARAVASHRSAARLHGILPSAGRLEVTVPLGRNAVVPGVTVHRSNLLLPQFVTTVDRTPCTTGARTVVDLSAVQSKEALAKAMDAADRLGVATYLEVDDAYRRMRKRGRRKTTWVEEALLLRLDGTGSGDSEWELRVGRWLERAGLGELVSQHSVIVGGERFVLDFAFVAEKVAPEYDGYSVHRQRGRYDNDRRRWRKLELAGWLVLPYTSTCTELEVVTEVRAALAMRRQQVAA
jgi:very-short-patch-repair endonuclease